MEKKVSNRWQTDASEGVVYQPGEEEFAEVVAMLVKYGAVGMTGKSAAPTAVDGNGEPSDAAAVR